MDLFVFFTVPLSKNLWYFYPTIFMAQFYSDLEGTDVN